MGHDVNINSIGAQDAKLLYNRDRDRDRRMFDLKNRQGNGYFVFYIFFCHIGVCCSGRSFIQSQSLTLQNKQEILGKLIIRIPALIRLGSHRKRPVQ
jgi:hypothetical protein